MLDMNSNRFHLEGIEEMGRIQLVAKMCHIWMSFYNGNMIWILALNIYYERLNGSWQV